MAMEYFPGSIWHYSLVQDDDVVAVAVAGVAENPVEA